MCALYFNKNGQKKKEKKQLVGGPPELSPSSLETRLRKRLCRLMEEEKHSVHRWAHRQGGSFGSL